VENSSSSEVRLDSIVSLISVKLNIALKQEVKKWKVREMVCGRGPMRNKRRNRKIERGS
jgi:hypothetical protein